MHSKVSIGSKLTICLLSPCYTPISQVLMRTRIAQNKSNYTKINKIDPKAQTYYSLSYFNSMEQQGYLFFLFKLSHNTSHLKNNRSINQSSSKLSRCQSGHDQGQNYSLLSLRSLYGDAYSLISLKGRDCQWYYISHLLITFKNENNSYFNNDTEQLKGKTSQVLPQKQSIFEKGLYCYNTNTITLNANILYL